MTSTAPTVVPVERFRDLHGALLGLVSTINGPRGDKLIMQEAGIHLDQTLFPLLVLIERFGPIGVVELADRMGRDYTTVSRQSAKLQQQGLIARGNHPADRRIRTAVITSIGKATTGLIDAARARLLQDALSGWEPQDISRLAALLSRFAEGLSAAGYADRSEPTWGWHTKGAQIYVSGMTGCEVVIVDQKSDITVKNMPRLCPYCA